ncbi:DsbC family protein, partial [Escherichia coli]|nr:DsbC family protein [Escherichia coli]
NVTIYTFLYPLESLHPEAKTKAVSVWCAPNKAKAWSELMLAGKKPKLVACNNPVNDNLVLGSKLGVVGTPTLIAADGPVLPGSAPAAKLDQWLNPGAAALPAFSHWPIVSAGAEPGRRRPSAAISVGVPTTTGLEPSNRSSLMV